MLNYKIKVRKHRKYIEITRQFYRKKVLKIPAFINGIPVERIAKNAFAFNEIKQVKLPETLIDIAEGAFKYCYLKSIQIPKSVRYIGKHAFLCNPIDDVIIRLNVNCYLPGSFSDCPFAWNVDDTNLFGFSYFLADEKYLITPNLTYDTYELVAVMPETMPDSIVLKTDAFKMPLRTDKFAKIKAATKYLSAKSTDHNNSLAISKYLTERAIHRKYTYHLRNFVNSKKQKAKKLSAYCQMLKESVYVYHLRHRQQNIISKHYDFDYFFDVPAIKMLVKQWLKKQFADEDDKLFYLQNKIRRIAWTHSDKADKNLADIFLKRTGWCRNVAIFAGIALSVAGYVARTVEYSTLTEKSNNYSYENFAIKNYGHLTTQIFYNHRWLNFECFNDENYISEKITDRNISDYFLPDDFNWENFTKDEQIVLIASFGNVYTNLKTPRFDLNLQEKIVALLTLKNADFATIYYRDLVAKEPTKYDNLISTFDIENYFSKSNFLKAKINRWKLTDEDDFYDLINSLHS